MVFIAAVVMGIVAYRTLPVSLMPDIPIPVVTVNISYSNSSARELENAVVKPIRMQLLQVANLNDIKSETRDGQAVITMRFDYGTNIDYAFIEANEKIDGAMNVLPRDLVRPRVIKASASDIPVFYLSLSFTDSESRNYPNQYEQNLRFIELSEFAESVIRRRIEQLPEVALVDLSGTMTPQLTIEPDFQKMQSLGLTINQLEEALLYNNVNAGSIMVRDGHYQYNVRFSSVLRNSGDVENIVIKTSGKILKLKEIAKVTVDPQELTGMFETNGKPAITMAVIKQADARLADMKDKIGSMVRQFETDYKGMHFEISQDQTQLLDYSISNLKQNLGQGLLLVILVVFVFLKDLRLPLLIGFSLLVSVIISLLFFSFMNLSINILSLAGLILAVGNMMDNSIVVTDNISQYRERNYSVDDACVAGTDEVIVPQLSSMLVNIAVFLPLIFLSGIAGAIMYDEAIAVSIGLSVSYLVGITFMPVIYRLAYSRANTAGDKLRRFKEKIFEKAGTGIKRFFDLEKIYMAGLDFTFRFKRLNILLYILMIPLGFFILLLIEKEKMPSLTRTEVIINIEWNENINAGENKLRIRQLLDYIEPETVRSNSFIGRQQFMLSHNKYMSPSEARIYIKSFSPENTATVEKMANNFVKERYGKAKIVFEPPVSIFEKLFSSDEPPLVAELTMKNPGLEPDVDIILKVCNDLNEVKSLGSLNKIPLQDQIVLVADMEKLLLYDVSYDALLKELKTALRENTAGTLRSFRRFIPIVITDKELSINELIEKGGVLNNNNVIIPLNALVTITKSRELKTITAGKDGEFVPLVFAPASKEKHRYIKQIKETVKKAETLDVRFSGSVFTNLKLLKEIAALLVVSILLLYFILAAQFESLTQPLLVLMELPIDVAGALVVLYIAGQTLNLMSAMGMVIMCGIIITDSILKLDVINHLRKEGYSLMDAIKTGGHRRLRAIIMTSLTSILAMLPLLFTTDMGSELQKPFSYALIGGMVVGTMVSLYLVPLVYWYIYKNETIAKS